MRRRVAEFGAPARLLAFAALLALVGAIAALAGAATGDGGAASVHGHGEVGAMAMEDSSTAAQSSANGLASVAGGYTFVPEQTTLPRGRATAFRFRILDGDGRVVRDFDRDGGVRLHLIVVRRDFVGYRHVHPTLGTDGAWLVPLALSDPGAYRAFADFEIDGEKTVLGQDLFVPGRFAPAHLSAPRRLTSVDGYTVGFAHDTLRAGHETELRFRVAHGARAVASFDSYVGHRGHLVALRDGDLAYLHVHPLRYGRASEIVFHTAFPSAGQFRLFLQFKVGGVVHTAPFTVEVAR